MLVRSSVTYLIHNKIIYERVENELVYWLSKENICIIIMMLALS